MIEAALILLALAVLAAGLLAASGLVLWLLRSKDDDE
jgi:uncharacterized iron-regulated membrane protein